LWTHLIVKEDAHEIYGFLSQPTRQFFRVLIKISGVGPKMALTILSGIDLSIFVQAIERQNVDCLTCLPGIGQKTAERLMLELRDKFKKNSIEWQSLAASSIAVVPASVVNQELVLEASETSVPEKNKAKKTTPAVDVKAVMEDAISALINLGYKPPDAHQAVSRAFQQITNSDVVPDLSSEALIRQALQGFSRV
jgi:Holliday junction DNA helicase RuvA